MSRAFKTARVYADPAHFLRPQLMGLLHHQPAASGGVFSFEYDAGWLKASEALAFDPDLNLVAGPKVPMLTQDACESRVA